MRLDPRPCGPLEAVERVSRFVGVKMPYSFGGGGYHPRDVGGIFTDDPWSPNQSGLMGCDCWGLVRFGYKLPSARPGYNHGAWATVSDDVNSNSAIEDARHARDLWTIVTTPQVGDVLSYPTIRLTGRARPWIGHGAIVEKVTRVLEWNPLEPDYTLLDIIQCCGGPGRMPSFIRSDGSVFAHHDHDWPHEEHRTVILRAIA